MAEIVRQCIHSFADGFRDAILGIAQFYNRDNASKKQQQPERPLTVLARRRADRIRHQNEESNRCQIATAQCLLNTVNFGPEYIAVT